MSINRYDLYSLNINQQIEKCCETDFTMSAINELMECKTILQAKNFLKSKWNIEKCVSNYRLADVGYLTSVDTDKFFKITVSCSNDVFINLLPKK